MKKSFPIFLSLLTILLLPFRVFAADLTTIQETVSDYLPYILIGGAVILLISIIGILLGKKKNKNTTSEPIEIAQPATPQPIATEEVKTPVMEETPEVTPAVNMDTISNNLYSPTPEELPERPPIQETLGATPQPVPETSDQSSDLQAILQQESSSEPMTPVTDQAFNSVPTPEVKQSPLPESSTISPMDNTLSTMPEQSPVPPIDTTTSTTPDLQQFVNNQVAEVPPMAAPVAETPASTDTTTPAPTGTPSIV